MHTNTHKRGYNRILSLKRSNNLERSVSASVQFSFIANRRPSNKRTFRSQSFDCSAPCSRMLRSDRALHNHTHRSVQEVRMVLLPDPVRRPHPESMAFLSAHETKEKQTDTTAAERCHCEKQFCWTPKTTKGMHPCWVTIESQRFSRHSFFCSHPFVPSCPLSLPFVLLLLLSCGCLCVCVARWMSLPHSVSTSICSRTCPMTKRSNNN